MGARTEPEPGCEAGTRTAPEPGCEAGARTAPEPGCEAGTRTAPEPGCAACGRGMPDCEAEAGCAARVAGADWPGGRAADGPGRATAGWAGAAGPRLRVDW